MDGTTRLWDSDGRPLAVLREHEGRVARAVFSPSGDRVLTAGRETVRIWDWDARKQSKKLKGHEGGVSGVAFSPDNKTVAIEFEPNGKIVAEE